jgi:hypothetical protein
MPNDLPAGGRRRRWLSHPFLLAGTAALAVATGAGIALAATSSSSIALSAGQLSSATSPSTSLPRLRAGCVRVTTPARTGLLCRRRAFAGALHGTLVVPKRGGGTVTVEIQNGKVTSVSQSSITLKSADGFTKTYTVTASTIVAAQRAGISSVKTGDEVWVAATVNGGSVTAVRIRDISQLRPGLSGGSHLSGQPAGSTTGDADTTWPGWVTSFSGGSASG